MNFQCTISVGEIIGHIIVWLLLSLITLGIALFFYPYSLAKLILNNTSVIEEDGRHRQVSCNVSMFSQLSHVIIWILISIVTLGIGYLFYFYKVWAYVIRHATLSQ